MTRRFPIALLLLLASVQWACDSPTESVTLDVTLVGSPDPALAEPSSGVTYTVDGETDDDPDVVVEYPWRVSFVVVITESGGTALDVTNVNVAVQQASGGIVIAPSGGEVEHYQFNSSAGGNRLTALGSLSIGFEVWYDLPNDGREALITVSLSFRDDDGRVFQDVAEVKVAP